MVPFFHLFINRNLYLYVIAVQHVSYHIIRYFLCFQHDNICFLLEHLTIYFNIITVIFMFGSTILSSSCVTYSVFLFPSFSPSFGLFKEGRVQEAADNSQMGLSLGDENHLS